MAEETAGAIIGRNVRRLRDGGLWTREELADRARVSRQTIAHLELGTSGKPRRVTIEKLARALGVPVATLLAGTDGDALPKAQSPLPPPDQRPDDAFVLTGRIVEDEDGDQRFRWVVKWVAPEQERGQYRAVLREMTGGDYAEEEMTPEAAEVLMAGAV